MSEEIKNNELTDEELEQVNGGMKKLNYDKPLFMPTVTAEGAAAQAVYGDSLLDETNGL